MAKDQFDSLIVATPNGAKIQLDGVYVYKAGNGYFLGKDGSNQPVGDAYEMIEHFIRLVRKAQHKAELIDRMKRKNLPSATIAG
jgi:hypothetical protein